MSRNTIKWLAFLIGILLLSAIACTIWDGLGGLAKLDVDVPKSWR
jgi:hypothetical protein